METPELVDLRDLYLLRCEVEGKTPRTVRAYRETVGRFIDRLPAEVRSPSDVRPEHIDSYLAAYTQHSLETWHRYFREVRCFFRWLVELEYVERDPFRGMRNVRVPQRIIEAFSQIDITNLLRVCDESPIGMRDRAILFVLLDTGARCSEVTSLELVDADLERRRLRILHAKGNKQRTVSFADRCQLALADYIGLRGDAPGPLFLAATFAPPILICTAALHSGRVQIARTAPSAGALTTSHDHGRCRTRRPDTSRSPAGRGRTHRSSNPISQTKSTSYRRSTRW